MKIKLIHSGLYQQPQKIFQRYFNFHLSLFIDGWEYLHHRTPGGAEIGVEESKPGAGPFLSLMPSDSTLDFAMNEKRKNFVIIAEFPEIRWSEEQKCCLCQEIRLQPFKSVSLEKCRVLSGIFSRITENFRSGLPADLFGAELLIASLLAELLPEPVQQKNPSGAALFKQAIERDATFRIPLAELQRQCGSYTSCYMRRLFEKEYGIAPAEYRARLRMNRICELMAESNLNLKEIADAIGMNHVTHLYAFLKQRENRTPSELLRQFRNQ